jgi:hypothetical protein
MTRWSMLTFGKRNRAANPSKRQPRMDCRIKFTAGPATSGRTRLSGNDEQKSVLAARFFCARGLLNLVIASVSEAIQPSAHNLDCFVATAPRNDDDHDHDHDHERKGSETPANALSFARTQAACGAHHGKGGLRRPPLAGALACRRSTAVLTSGTFVPRAQHRARLPEAGAKAAACRTRRVPVTAMHLARRSLVPAGMMPEPPGCGVYPSARGRRTRSAFRKYPP